MKKIITADFLRFIKKFTIILACIFVVDYCVGKGLKYLYIHQKSGLLYRTYYSLNITKADILVFGSSRASHHYNPKIFEQKLNMSFYNCGRDGHGTVYACAVASSIIHRYKPKCIIIDILKNEFTSNDRVYSLYPFNDNVIIHKYLSYGGPYENIKLMSNIYAYNSQLINLILGLNIINKKKADDYNGYLPLKGSNVKNGFVNSSANNNIDEEKVKYFKELLLQTNKLGIPILVIISPLYKSEVNATNLKLVQNLCAKFKSVKFLDYSNDPISSNPLYFKDNYHMNELGANVFSNKLLDPVNKLINDKP